jgi:glycine hydroxymethyltransferase
MDQMLKLRRPIATTNTMETQPPVSCLNDVDLLHVDPEVFELIRLQKEQEVTMLKLIASENYASGAVLAATGSVFTNKYAEGYAGRRYYEGNEIADRLEKLCCERARSLFGAEHANVQPYSGSPANLAVHRALLRPGDKIMGLSLPQGGHLTHGWHVNFSGIDYCSISYGLNSISERIDYDEMRSLALRERPKLIWMGGTAYPRTLDFEVASQIATEVEAYLVADIAHISGLVIAGVHPNPTSVADVVTSTSHKSLRGPRGGFILTRELDRYQHLYHKQTSRNLAQRVDRAVFPTLQGGPHLNVIAALAVAFEEASQPAFRAYGQQIVKNARSLAEELLSLGYRLVTGGTDNHLMIVDLRDSAASGKEHAQSLAKAGIITNFNMVPNDPRKATSTSGIRIGVPAVTSMGMVEDHMVQIARFFDTAMRARTDATSLEAIREKVREFCGHFSVPGINAPTR